MILSVMEKAVYNNNYIYVFAEEGTQVVMTKTADGKNWSELTTIDIPVSTDYSSVMIWGNQFYILAEKELYTSNDGLQWSKVESAQKITRLLANIDTEHNHKIIGVDPENYYIESEDGVIWNWNNGIDDQRNLSDSDKDNDHQATILGLKLRDYLDTGEL